MLKKLANGEYSLKVIFWLFGILGFLLFFLITSITHAGALKYICPAGNICSRTIILYILYNFINLMMRGTQTGIMSYLAFHLLCSASFVIYMYITLRGLWKSCASYEGAKFWEWGAKITLVLLALVSFKSIL